MTPDPCKHIADDIKKLQAKVDLLKSQPDKAGKGKIHQLNIQISTKKNQLQVCQKGHRQKLDDITSYSNFGYVLLGLVVEKMKKMPFIDYVQQILKSKGLDKIYLASTPKTGKKPNEVTYDDPGHGPSVFNPNSNVSLPNPYGGGGFITELMDSGGGLAATATELAMFINKYPAWGIGKVRSGNTARSGGMSGTSSYAESYDRPEAGGKITMIVNTSTFPKRPLYQDPPAKDPKNKALVNLLHYLLSKAKF